MDAFPPAPYRVVAISVMVAAVAVTVAALVVIAVALGWIAPHASSDVGSSASAGAATANAAALSPGETVVSPAEAPAPATNAKPGPGTPVYRHDEEKAKSPAAHGKTTAAHKPAAGTPARGRGSEGICENCGTVSGTFAYPDAFAVSVRFEDGSSRTFRFASRPPFRVGEKVFDEGGRLVPAR